MNLFYKLASVAAFAAAALTSQADPARVWGVDFTSDAAAAANEVTIIKDGNVGWEPWTKATYWYTQCLWISSDAAEYAAKPVSYIVSPGIELKAGNVYMLNACATQYGGLKANITGYVGKEPTKAGLSNAIMSTATPRNTTEFQLFNSEGFTPEADGTYYFALAGQVTGGGFGDLACTKMYVECVYSPVPDTPEVPEEYVVDVLTVTDFVKADGTSISGATNYAAVNAKGVSGAEYYGNMAGGNNAIQLRSKNYNSGFVTTVSGGLVKKIVVKWNAATDAARTLDIYAKNEAYDAATDLYQTEKAGTKVASLKKSDAVEGVSTYEFTDEYAFLGVRSADNAMYLDEVEITWAVDKSKVLPPVFTPATDFIVAGTEVTITCATEGAKIYYTMGENPEDPTTESTLYTAPIVVNDYATIKAIAERDGNLSSVSTISYTIVPEVDNLASLADFEDKTPFILTTELTVVYVNGSNVYVTDGLSYAKFYKYGLNLEAGQVIKAGWQGITQDYNGLQQLEPSTALEVEAEKVAVPSPTAVSAEDASLYLAVYNANRYLLLLDVTFDQATPAGSANFTGKIGEDEYEFRNSYGVASVEAGTYDVAGFVGVYNDKVQFYPVSIEKRASLKSLRDLNKMTPYAPFVVDCDLTVACVVADMGYNIVTDGDIFSVIMANPVSEGDIIAKGWTAIYDPDFMVMTTVDDAPLPVSGKADAVPAPAPFDLNVLYPNSYVVFESLNLAQGLPESDEVFQVEWKDGINLDFSNGFFLDPATAGEYKVVALITLGETDSQYIFLPVALTPLGASAKSYTVYYNNGATAWEAVNAYVWDSANIPVAAWPGQPATFDAEKNLWVYTFETTLEPAHIIFNNGNGSQTDDLDFENEKVYGEAAPETAVIYLRGGMNSWGTDDAWKLATTDGVNYTLANVTIEAGVEFKIADANWSVYDFGGMPNMALNTKYTLEKGAGTSNCTLAETMNNGTINFNVETGEVEFIGVADGIDAINAINGAEYFNLQGVKVERPTQGGLYIRLQGGKATKVLVK